MIGFMDIVLTVIGFVGMIIALAVGSSMGAYLKKGGK